MIIGIRHLGIVVEDMYDSLEFYRNILGFKPVITAEENSTFINKILSIDSSELKTCKLKSNDGSMIELLDFGKDTKKRVNFISSVGPTHLALTVDDAEAVFLSMKDKGVEFISAPQTSPDNYAKVAFCKAPEGTYIEIVEVLN